MDEQLESLIPQLDPQEEFDTLLQVLAKKDQDLVRAHERMNKRLVQLHSHSGPFFSRCSKSGQTSAKSDGKENKNKTKNQSSAAVIVSDIADRARYAHTLGNTLIQSCKLMFVKLDDEESQWTVVKVLERLDGLWSVIAKMCHTVLRYGEEDAEHLLQWLQTYKSSSPKNPVDAALSWLYKQHSRNPMVVYIIGIFSALLVGGIVGGILVASGAATTLAGIIGFTQEGATCLAGALGIEGAAIAADTVVGASIGVGAALVAGTSLFAGVSIRGRNVTMSTLDKHLKQLERDSHRINARIEQDPQLVNELVAVVTSASQVYLQVNEQLEVALTKAYDRSCPICLVEFRGRHRVAVSRSSEQCRQHLLMCVRCYHSYSQDCKRKGMGKLVPCPVCQRDIADPLVIITEDIESEACSLPASKRLPSSELLAESEDSGV